MALLAAIGFDHLEGLANWYSFLDQLMTASAASAPNPRAIVTNGWLGTTNTVTNNNDVIQLPLRTLASPGASKITVGIRVRADVTSTSNLISIAGNTAQRPLCAPSTAGFDPLATSGGTAYLEFEIPLNTGTIVVKRWVNGQPVSDLNVSDYLSNSGGGLLYMYMKNASAGRMAFRDIYVLDDTGAEFNTRLGPRKLAPVTLDAADGPNWTFTSGSVLAALSTPGEDPTANKATSPLSKDVLTAGLHCVVETGAKIEAVVLTLGGKSTATGNTTLGAKLKNGTDELALPNVVLTTTQNVSNPLAISSKAPNGAPWTSALLEGTNLVITPDIGA